MNLFILHWSNKIEKVDIIAKFQKKGWREENLKKKKKTVILKLIWDFWKVKHTKNYPSGAFSIEAFSGC